MQQRPYYFDVASLRNPLADSVFQDLNEMGFFFVRALVITLLPSSKLGISCTAEIKIKAFVRLLVEEL
ncbi:MAG: hypothetical protein HY070_03710 [Chloroflexi bacterium]|nr:hypothetical protein [Chloroflexota bacterium]